MKSYRASLIAMIHAGAKRACWDEDLRRAWLERTTGKRSCADLKESELHTAVQALRTLGYLDDRPQSARESTAGEERPTPKQWALADKLARDCGLPDGKRDPGFFTFMRRTVKQESPRHLTTAQMRQLIAGLQNWKKSKAGAPKATA